jgi:hypothetical protein
VFAGPTDPNYLASGFKFVNGVWTTDGFEFTPDSAITHTAQGYPDGNPKSAQGAKKYSLRYLPTSASVEVNRALEDGAKKYGPANWREKGVATSVYVDAALRHIALYFDCKQDNASDSGVHNLGHAMACLAIIIDAEKAGTLTDDRPFPFPDGDALLLRS